MLENSRREAYQIEDMKRDRERCWVKPAGINAATTNGLHWRR